MIFEQQPQRGDLLELVGGNRRDLESPLPSATIRPSDDIRFRSSRSVLMLVP